MIKTDNELPDFVALHAYYRSLGPGSQAELRRAAQLDDVTFTPALYRLFPGIRPTPGHQRIAFLLPWCSHRAGAASLGAQFAKEGIAEARVIQMARARPPTDLNQLRRLVNHVDPAVDWAEFGKTLWYWGNTVKRRLVEDFYLAQFKPAKGAAQ